MSEQMPAPDRYSVQYVELPGEGEAETSAKLQDILNEGSRSSHKLIGVATDPAGKGVILFWDMEGFLSG